MTAAMEVLERRFPALARRARRAEGSSTESAANWVGRTLNPDRIVERWKAGLTLPEFGAVALSGMGDGRHLVALLSDLPRGCFVFCAEQDPGTLRRVLESPLGESLLRDPRLFVGCGDLNEEFFESMRAFPVLDVQDAVPVIFAPEYNRQPDYYDKFFLEFARSVNYWRKLHGTNAVASGVWQENTASNLKQLIDAPDVGAFRGAFEGEEMIVAGAGPSLDESLDYLKSVDGRAVVVAVNSSFRALRNAGVDPHFVLAADPYKWVDKGFEGVELGRAILVCPFIVFPAAPRRFVGRTITWSKDNLLASFFRLKIGLPLGSRILEQGTVTACAFDFARILGCRSLTFVGQDMAIRNDGRSHARDSFYTDLNSNRMDVGKCRRMPGNTIEEVPVEEKLYVYLKTFEELARKVKGAMRLRNLSRLGARIEGVPYVPIEEALKELVLRKAGSVDGAWKRVRGRCRPTSRRHALEREVVAFENFAAKMTRQALRGAITLEQVELSAPDANDALTKALAVREELASLLESEPDYHTVLRDGQLKYELLQHVRETRAVAATADTLEREAAELKSYFWAVAEGGYRFTLALQEARKREVEE